MWDVAILAGARTPFTLRAGTPGAAGALKDLDVFDLGATALRGALDRARLGGERLDAIAFGNVYPTTPQTVYGARYVGLKAGVPERVPCLTPNMACGSGLYALVAAASELARGAGIVAAGGAENISQIRKDFLLRSFQDTSAGGAIGKYVEELASEYGVDRDSQDRWALRSHAQARRALTQGLFAQEIVPAGGVYHDDAPALAPAPGDFSAATPTFSESGTVTRANSHAIVDGAAALLLASPEAARRAPAPPLGRLRAAAYSGVAPRRMGYASVPAIRELLSGAGLALRDIDLFEINETFAAQVLIDVRELGLPEEKVNVNGGAIALGHPFAATGCRQVLSLLLEMRRRNARRGVASICVGGGQGIAVLVEAP